MNCVVKCLEKVLDIKNHEIYAGIGHSEPIHIAEVVAYLLTQGYGAIPREIRDPSLVEFTRLIEGYQADGTPHMLVEFANGTIYDPYIKEGAFRPELFWYLVPIQVSEDFRRRYTKTRDSWISAALKDARLGG